MGRKRKGKRIKRSRSYVLGQNKMSGKSFGKLMREQSRLNPEHVVSSHSEPLLVLQLPTEVEIHVVD